MTTDHALLASTRAYSTKAYSTHKPSLRPIRTAVLYGAIWITGAAALTAAHGLSGGRYQSDEQQSSAPPAVLIEFNRTPMRDPFPEFDDEKIPTRDTTWAANGDFSQRYAPVFGFSGGPSVPYRVVRAPNSLNAPPVVTSVAPPPSVAGIASFGDTSVLPTENTRKSTKKTATTVTGAVAPPGLIYMNDSAPAMAANRLASRPGPAIDDKSDYGH